MKKLLLSIVLLIASAISFAQTSGGPDAYGYIWRDNNDAQGPTYNWIDVPSRAGAVKVLTLTDDNTTGFIQLGFNFPYYWYDVSQFKIGSNGYIIFMNGALASPFPAIPTPSALKNNFIAGFMSDLSFAGAGDTGQCWYWSNASDSLIISYINVPFYANTIPPWTGSNTFQIILSKVDTSITFQYQSQMGSTSVGDNHDISIGIENNSGSIGLQHSLDTYPTPLSAVKFYYPQGSTFSVNDASTSYCNNVDNGGLFISRHGVPFTMNSEIKNTGNQPLSAFNVDLRVLKGNTTQVQQTLASSALNPDQSEDLTATTIFSADSTPGVYKFRTTTQLTGDATPSNNFKTLELRLVDTTLSTITLTYTGDTPVPATGVSWTGGDGGVGVEFVPPFYPCYIQSADFYIISNATPAVDFHSLIYDNTGLDGGPGNLLDSTYVTGAEITVAGWNTVSLTTPIEIDSGSVFVAWMMDGNAIVLGTDTTSPISNRSYEILGSWSIYRDREIADPMIRINVSTTAIPQGIDNAVSPDAFIGEFYPSPSNGKVSLNLNLLKDSKETTFSFYNIQGQLIESRRMALSASQQKVSFDISKFGSGVYFCKITNGTNEYNRQLIIGK